MKIGISASLDDTAAATWRLREIATLFARPFAAALRRRRLLAAYAALPPAILRDIGLAEPDIAAASAVRQPGAQLLSAYRLRRR